MKNAILEILVPKGEPTGLRIVKLAGWIGKAFVAPRADLKELKDYREASLPAIYFLFGETKDEKPSVYIGQTDNLFRRLNQQDIGKDDWNVALIFTGEADVDVLYLEKKAAVQAREAGRYKLLNSVDPSGRNLSDFRQAANDDFFEKVVFVTALLGFNLFQEAPKEQSASEIYLLSNIKDKDAQGKGTLLNNGEFVVFAGSLARLHETESFKSQAGGYLTLRRQLIAEGVLKPNGDEKSYVVTKDYVFSSPSAAGAVIMGRAVNGWTGWKTQDGLTLDERKRKVVSTS